ncbi:MAG: hypothetical protein J1F39_07460 [Clostridiales bacterium]|nr:hypothetical protein [Clostridiales bacterium]
MLVGLIILGIVAALMFFGVMGRVYKNCGMPFPLAFAVVGLLIGGAFIPAVRTSGATVGAAGFIVPLAVSAVFIYLASRRRELIRSFVATVTAAAVYTSVELLLVLVANDSVIVIVQGLLCGFVAYLVGKTELAALCGVFIGVPLGEVAVGVTNRFAYGEQFGIGGASAFNALIIAAVLSVVLYEVVYAVKYAANKKRRKLATEAAEEIDPNEYKKYFDE